MTGPPAGRAPRCVARPDELARAVARVAHEIDADHPGGVTLVGVLKSAVVLLADLSRRLTVPARIELVAMAPYDGEAGRTRVVKDLDRPVTDERVVVVTGTVDTGLSLDFLRRHLDGGRPRSLRVAALVDKRARRLVPIEPDYAAVEVADGFLVGYGLDLGGRYRNLPGLWEVDGPSLAADPDRHVATFYGGSRPPSPVGPNG